MRKPRCWGEVGGSGRNGCWTRWGQWVEGRQRAGEMGGGIGRGMSGETPEEVVNPGRSLGQDETFGASRASLTTSPTAPSLLRVFWSGNSSCWLAVSYSSCKVDPNGSSTRLRDESVCAETGSPSLMSNPLNLRKRTGSQWFAIYGLSTYTLLNFEAVLRDQGGQ